jgi:hypothetical protein
MTAGGQRSRSVLCVPFNGTFGILAGPVARGVTDSGAVESESGR